MSLRTSYEFTLPRGYVDAHGRVHRSGVMRLATARDELEPLRDPMLSGPDDPRLTILVLARVVERLGDLEMVTSHEIEGLFAADLAFLQDFYGVINFGDQQEYEALLAAHSDGPPAPAPVESSPVPAATVEAPSAAEAPVSGAPAEGRGGARRSAIEEMPAAGR